MQNNTHSYIQDERNQNIKIYINGEIYERPNAKISVFDSGFLLGDGVWEGVRLFNGKWIFLSEHLERLYSAAKAIDLEIGVSSQTLIDFLEKTRLANEMKTDVHARLMVTRGKKTRPFQHPKLSVYGSTIVIIMEHSKATNLDSGGVRLSTVHQVRGLPTSQDPKLNSHSKLNCVLACIQAEKAGADEALMLDPLGFVNTTNSCNFFLVKDGQVWTSSGDYCMNGITRQKVIDICKTNNIEVFERNFSLLDAYNADESFITGTFGGQTFVSEIDKHQIGNGEMGPLTKRIKELYFKIISNEC